MIDKKIGVAMLVTVYDMKAATEMLERATEARADGGAPIPPGLTGGQPSAARLSATARLRPAA